MSHFTRARSVADKVSRRGSIVSAAATVLERRGRAAATVAEIAREAHVAKGTVFLYFASREALFLDLLDQLLDEWLGALHHEVARDTGPLAPTALAGVIADSLVARPLLGRLLSFGTGELERNVPAERVADFRHRLMRRLFATGALVEQRLRLARNGDGVRALQFAYALILGLRQRADTPTDFDTDLRAGLTILFNGFHRTER